MVAGCNISAKEDTGTGKEAGVVFLRVWAVRSHGLPRTVLRDGVCGYEKRHPEFPQQGTPDA